LCKLKDTNAVKYGFTERLLNPSTHDTRQQSTLLKQSAGASRPGFQNNPAPDAFGLAIITVWAAAFHPTVRW
jgi:hypothetical protein